MKQEPDSSSISSQLLASSARLRIRLDKLEFGEPVSHVYNPLAYAWAPQQLYLEKFANSRKRVLFMGMNPGPWGMTQTGVPFGEISFVRDWMEVEAPVARPEREHPKRPVEGFACKKSEVSGRRLWGLFSDRFGTAEAFFQDHLVINYCPLVWMSASGANLTPDKLSQAAMAPVEEACQENLVSAIRILQPEFLVGVGAFAAQRLKKAAASTGGDIHVGQILHPSPASPAANRGWAAAAEKQLKEMGVWD